jgi:hypothetical protein
MRASRWGIVLWSILIVILLVVEVAEITHLFTLPIQLAIGDPLAFVFALVFTTILALVGAVYIGIYISARLLRTQGFTPFEEEMLKMRGDIRDVRAMVEEMQRADDAPVDAPTKPPAGGRS